MSLYILNGLKEEADQHIDDELSEDEEDDDVEDEDYVAPSYFEYGEEECENINNPNEEKVLFIEHHAD